MIQIQALLQYLIKKKGNNRTKKESEKAKVIFTIYSIENGHNIQTVEWTEEGDQKLFRLYKEKGSHWSIIAAEFPGLNENQVKNRFYSTLRRLATKKALDSANGDQCIKTKKKDLIEFVDEAIVSGHNCRSKRGRKRKQKIVEPDNTKDKQEVVTIEENRSLEGKVSEGQYVVALENKPQRKMHKNERITIKIEEDDKWNEEHNVAKEELSNEDVKQDTIRYEPEPSLGYFSLEDSAFIQRLMVQNDSILNEYEEITRDQSTDLEELLELEKEMEKRLMATQKFLGAGGEICFT